MDTDPEPPRMRQRAKNFKTEITLRAVEQRSLADIMLLSTPLGWPSNPDDGSIAIQLVFGLLEDETMPPDGFPESEHVRQRMMFVRRCVEVVMTSVSHLMSKTNGRAKEIYSPIYKENLGTYSRWLLFLARETTWIYAEHVEETALKFGPSFAGEALETMYSNGTEDLRALMRQSMPMIDLMLYLWRWKSPVGKPMYIQYDVEGQSCPLVCLVSCFVPDAGSMKVFRQRVESFTPRAHQALIDGSLARLRLWKASRSKSKSFPPISDPITIVNLMQSFLKVPLFIKAYVKSRFPFHAFSTLSAFTDLRVTSAHNREVTPLPVAVGSTLLLADPGFRPAFLVQGVVSQLLDADLLRVIADDMLSEQQVSEYPFRRWRQGPEWPFGPLDILSASGVDKVVCDATVRGLSRLPDGQKISLARGRLGARWSMFMICFRAYEDAWTEATKPLPVICDNLSHHTRASPKTSRSLKCSHCGVAVYCSAQCQREDWDAYHGAECPPGRIYRIDRQIATSWVSHNKRMFLCTLLHHFVINYEIGYRPESNFGQVKRAGSVLVYGGARLRGHMAAEEHKRRIVQFSIKYGPVDITTHNVQELLETNFNGNAGYDALRWRKMFMEMEESAKRYDEVGGVRGLDDALRYRIKLAALVSLAGEYRVFVTGRFVVGKSVHRTTVEFLNGYVNVEKNSGWDAGRVSNPVALPHGTGDPAILQSIL